MSWSVAFTGKAPEARAKISEQFKNSGPCIEPEETVRQLAAKLIDLALEAQAPDQEVKVSAYGSQNSIWHGGIPTVQGNSLNITITPQN